MKEQFEEQMREAFGNFEPKVDPALWAKISSQLPAAPVAQPGGVQTILSKVSSMGWWAAATVAVVGSSLLYFSRPDKSAKTPNTNEVVQPQPIQAKESVAVQTLESLTPAGQQKVELTSQQEISTENTSALPAADQQRSASPAASNDQAQNQPVALSVTAIAPAAAQPIAPVKTHTAEQPVTTGGGAPAAEPVVVAAVERTAEPVLILNTHGGFAPLQVTAMINSTTDKATFDFNGLAQMTNVSSATYRFDEAGSYTVTCETVGKRLSAEVTVLGILPSAFSPNGDGVNDQFVAASDLVQSIDLKIYDREGRPVFSGKGKQTAWDGHLSNGQPARDGTYFYHIFATSVNGETYEQKGTIRLFR